MLKKSHPKPSYLTCKDGSQLAYHQHIPKNIDIHNAGILFLGGFMSDMEGTKALFLHNLCINNGIPYTRFDYFGHGSSEGKFTDGTIGRWKDDVITIIDKLIKTPHIIIGSSMGGWLMLLATLERPEKVKALIGIAAAPDFTEDLIWNLLSKEEKQILKSEGQYILPTEYCNDPDPDPYPITTELIEEARKHMLLRNSIQINCPVRLIHGSNDKDVPQETSSNLMHALTSTDVHLNILKNADHRMSSNEALALLEAVVLQTISQHRNFDL